MIALGAAILALLAILMLQAPPVRRYALDQARAQLRQHYDTDLKIENLDLHLLGLWATAGPISLRRASDPKAPPFFEAARAAINVDLAAGLSVSIQTGSLDAPRVHVVIDENGRTNLPEPPPGPAAADTGLPAVPIASFQVRGGTVVVDDRQHAAHAELRDLSVDVSTKADPFAYVFKARSKGEVRAAGRVFPLDTLELDGRADQPGAITIERARLAGGEMTITARGTASASEPPVLRFSGDARLPLRLAEASIEGVAEAAFTLEGASGDLRAKAEVRSPSVETRGLPPVAIDGAIGWSERESRVNVERIAARSAAGSADAEGSLSLTGGGSRVTARYRNIDVARVAKAFGSGVIPGSMASGTASAAWPGLDYEKAQATLSTALVETQPPGAIPVSGAIAVRAGAGDIAITLDPVAAYATATTGTIHVTRTGGRLSGELETAANNAGAVVGSEGLKGAAQVSTRISGSLASPTAEFQIAAPALVAGKLDGVAVRASANYAAKRATIPNAAIEWRRQRITGSAEVDLEPATPVVTASRIEGDAVSLGAILAGLGFEQSGEGTLRLRASAKGPWNRLQGAADLTGSGLAVDGETLGTLAAHADLNGANIHLTRLELNQPGGGSLNAAGTLDLDTRLYSAKAGAAELKTRWGTIRLNGAGEGSLDDPAATGELAVDNALYEGREYGAVQAGFTVTGESAHVDVAAPKFNAAAKANIAMEAPHKSSITITASNTDLALLGLKLPREQTLSGNVTGTVEAFGPLDAPRTMSGRAHVEQLLAVAFGAELRNDGALEVSYDRERVTAEAVALQSVNSRMTLQGSLPLAGAGDEQGMAVTAKLDLAEWAPLIPESKSFQATGTLDIAGRVTGSLERLDPALEAKLTDGFFDSDQFNVAITQTGLEAKLENGVLHVARAEAAFGPAAFRAQGDIPLAALPVELPAMLPNRGSGPARFEASIEGLQLRAFRVLPEEVDSNIDIKLSGETPDVSSIEKLRGSIEINPQDLAYGKFPLRSEAAIRAEIADGNASILPFVITGEKTRLEGRGSVDLHNGVSFNVGIDGATDAELVSLFTDAVRADGGLRLRAAVTGTAQSPQVNGFFELTGGAARIPRTNPNSADIAASDLTMRLDFEGDRLQVSRLSGQVNGGTLSGTGGFRYAGGALRESDLALSVRDIFLDAPARLRTRSNAELRLLTPGPERAMTIAGSVRIQEGSYTDDINLDQQILEFLRASRGSVELQEEKNVFLENLRFAVDIETEEPLLLENNIGEMQVNADLRLGGSYYRPAVTGRLTAEEGGSLRLQGRNFDIERGVVTFTSETRIEPSLDIVARTRVKGKYDDYDVELAVTGGGSSKVETKLTADPDLPEPDIVALLTTGKTLEELQAGDSTVVARDQALSLVAGLASDRVSQGLERATGLSTVRIEPNLISTESTPGARLTVGQNITRELELIYSMNLAQSNDQIWIADYAFTRRFNTRAIKQADNSYRGEFRHDLRFGGVPETTRARKRDSRTVGAIRFEGDPGFTDKELLDKIKLRPGRKYNFFEVRKDLERLREFYAGRGLLEARLQVKRDEEGGQVSLVYTIHGGPRVDLIFEGSGVPGSVRKQVRQVWTDGLFDIQRTEDATAAIRQWLASKRQLAPTITHVIREPEPDRKQVIFDVDPGVEYNQVTLSFPGATAIPEEELRKQVEFVRLAEAARTEPAKVTAFLRDLYLRRGYLDARVGNADVVFHEESKTAEVRFSIDEGEPYKVETVSIEGNSAVGDQQLLAGLGLTPGGVYSAALRDAAVQKIEQQYWKLGYNDLDLRYEVNRGSGAGLAAVKFLVTENQRSMIRTVTVEGADHTTEAFVKKQIVLEQGLPVDLGLLGQSRRNLYDTGAYSLIEIEQQALGAATAPGTRDVAVKVRVRERRPFQVQYGAFYDTDRGPGVIADFTNRNSLGNARIVGVRTRYDGQIRELRAFFSQPYLRNLPARTNFTGFLRREIREGFTTDRRGAEFIQEIRLKEKFLLNYGFRFENTRVFEPNPEDPDFAFDSTVRIAPINVTGSRDTRDDLLDATRGSFLSQSFELAPLQIRDSLRYYRYFGQYFKYLALTRPAPVPLQEGVRRPRMIYAGGVRAGVGKGIGGQDLIISERFFAGGGTSMRGFEQDALGPTDFFGDPTGGEAVFLTNHELRFPMFSIFDGVGFMDMGNVFRRAGDFSLGDLRKSAGVGLRVRTPYFLLRLDWGFKLDRKPNEPRSRFFFSIGQAF
ncbi:MAG: translocation/assembly module TamB domain-containing protein [Bryobacteraceae bacterium]